jgi:hypothetical protein
MYNKYSRLTEIHRQQAARPPRQGGAGPAGRRTAFGAPAAGGTPKRFGGGRFVAAGGWPASVLCESICDVVVLLVNRYVIWLLFFV